MTTPSQRPTLMSDQPSTAYRVLAGLEGRPAPPAATRATSRMPTAHSRDISSRSIVIFICSFGVLVFMLAFYGTLREPETLSTLAVTDREVERMNDAGTRTEFASAAAESAEPARIIEMPQPTPSLPAVTNRMETADVLTPAVPQPVISVSKPSVKETVSERAAAAPAATGPSVLASTPRSTSGSTPRSAAPTSTPKQQAAATATPEVDSDVELLAALIARARQQDPKPQVPCIAGKTDCRAEQPATATR